MNKRKVAIALGSNMGNRLEMLRAALKEIESAELTVTAKSRVWETPPWGVACQPRFLNMCVTAESSLEPLEMLRRLKDAELRIGRKESDRWGPRLIDLDIILIESETFSSPKLTIPHPHMHERAFVLVPLAEIAPDMVNQKLGKTVAELLSELPEEKMDWIIRI